MYLIKNYGSHTTVVFATAVATMAADRDVYR